jgi:queuine tRNA-ribosyltransferase
MLPLPLFFPDATRGFVRELSFADVKAAGLPGILVNTFHLLREQGYAKTEAAGGVRPLIGWDGAIISDSGGFQVMSIAKKGNGRIMDEGVVFVMDGTEHLLTPEESIRYQLTMQTDLCVVLDDFTPPEATHEEAEETVRRTTLWAKRCKAEFERIVGNTDEWAERPRPYLIGVVQGGAYEDLRRRSIAELIEIGFDGYGYGGWPMKEGKFDVATARLIATEIGRIARAGGKTLPLLYGLGIGKPDDIVTCVDLGWQIFDCVLPTRDARHGRLYIYTAPSMGQIDVHAPGFYTYYNPTQANHREEKISVSPACDCELCTRHTRAELYGWWKARDNRVLRLATLHNLRFYALLMEKLQNT